MSERTKDWLKGSFSGWAAAIMLAVFSYLAKELHENMKMQQMTASMDRQKQAEQNAAIASKVTLLESETKASITLMRTENKYEMNQLQTKVDLLTRAVSDIRKAP